MRHPLAGFDGNLRPISRSQAKRRAEILAEMARTAQSAAPYVPGDDPVELSPVRRAVVEGGEALREMGIACAVAAPVAFALVVFWWS